MTVTREEAVARLTGPGGPFEVTTETVNGWPGIRVYRQRPRSLRELALRGADHGDDRPFLLCGPRSWGFHQFLVDANRVAHALADHLDVVPGDRVAVLSANNPEFALAFWATVNSGAVLVGLNGWWKAAEVVDAVVDAGPRVLVADRKRLARVAPELVRMPSVDHVVVIDDGGAAHLDDGDGGVGSWVAGGGRLHRFADLLEHPRADLPEVAIDEDDPAVIFYTSGTTGRSKGAVSTHRGMVCNIQNVLFTGAVAALTGAAATRPGAGPGQEHERRTLLTSPMFHVSGLHSGILLGYVTGQTHVLPEGRLTPELVMELIEQHRVTFWPSVPTMVWRVCQHPDRHRRDLSSITRIAFGGAPAGPELHAQARATFPNLVDDLGTGWGLTETTSAVTSITGPDYVARPTSVGRPFPVVELKVVDRHTGAEVAAGADGEILVRGCQVTPGYWNDPEATAAAIDADGWFRTGDVGHLDADGFLHLTDRTKDVILRGGENVYPVEIEHRLLGHPEVLDAAVIGVPHPELGEAVKAVVQVPVGAEVTGSELQAWTGEALADFKVPSVFELRTDPLPRNASGKLLKQVLRGVAADDRAETWER